MYLISSDRRKDELEIFSKNFTNIRRNTNITKKRKNLRTNKTFRRNKNRCPLRVAELSVPSKRHCLETWRNNKDILPCFMVHHTYIKFLFLIIQAVPMYVLSPAFLVGRKIATNSYG